MCRVVELRGGNHIEVRVFFLWSGNLRYHQVSSPSRTRLDRRRRLKENLFISHPVPVPYGNRV